MDFKQIEAFVNVVKYRSFSKAADAAFLTQPTISTHIQALERELGVKLIERRGRESVPTTEGADFYKYATDMLNTREKAMLEMNAFVKDVSGIVTIEASSVPAEFIAPELMAGFRAEHPNVRFFLNESDSEEVWGSIAGGRGEIGFVGSKRRNADIGRALLCRDESVVITPNQEKYRALHAKSSAISYKDFIHEPFVLREGGSATRSIFEELVYEQHGLHLNSAASVNSLDAVCHCVTAGVGVSVIPRSVAEQQKNDDFLMFRFADDELNMKREFYMIWNKTIAMAPAAVSFREYVMSRFK